MPASAEERSLDELLGVGVSGAPDGVPARGVFWGYGDGEKLPEGPQDVLGAWDLMTLPAGPTADGDMPGYEPEPGGCPLGLEGRWGDMGFVGGALMTEGEGAGAGVGDWATGFWEGTMPGKTGVMGVVGAGVVEGWEDTGVEGAEHVCGVMGAVLVTLVEGFC